MYVGLLESTKEKGAGQYFLSAMYKTAILFDLPAVAGDFGRMGPAGCKYKNGLDSSF
jgi:hypothetical protein